MKLFARGTAKNAKILKLSSIGIALMIAAALVIVIDPLQLLVDNQLTLKVGTILYNLWLKPPLEVFINVYVFNVTNLDAFMRGFDTKLKIVEVGPYVYQEFLENKNVTFNDNNTVTYTPQRAVKFIRERSVGDPKVDTIIAPNIPYMGIMSAASSFSAFAALAINALTRKFNSKPMLELSVHEYLWGYEDPLVQLASKIIPNVINFQRFGLMERMFDEGHNVVTMRLPSLVKQPEVPADEEALTEPMDRDFSIDNWNGERGFKNWDYRENQNKTFCNSLSGTYDGTLFPRSIRKGETFHIYRKAFCRTLAIQYSHPGDLNGFEGYIFKLKSNAFDSDVSDAETSCFCKNNHCLKKGLGSIRPCYYNIPLAVSFPHFFNADPSLMDGLDGLNPSEEKHGTEIIIQPQLGIPMRVRSRFQINLLMSDTKHIRDAQRFRNMVLPIFWLEMGVEDLTPGVKLLLTLLFKVCPYLQWGLIVTLVSTSVYLVGSALVYCCWMPASWTPLHNVKEQSCGVEGALSNVCILPLLKQPVVTDLKKLPAKKLAKTSKQKEYDATLLPLQCTLEKAFLV